MRAVVITKNGPPEVLQVQERPDAPVPGPGEVRIAVKAAGINFADTMARTGVYPDAPPVPSVVGYEVAGEIESVGDGVTDFFVGDRVIAGTKFGGYAELVTVPAGQLLSLPKKLSFEQGAAVPVNYGTAYAALVIMGGLRKGIGRSSTLPPVASGSQGRRSPSRSTPRSSAPRRRPSTTRSASRASRTRSTTATRTSRPR